MGTSGSLSRCLFYCSKFLYYCSLSIMYLYSWVLNDAFPPNWVKYILVCEDKSLRHKFIVWFESHAWRELIRRARTLPLLLQIYCCFGFLLFRFTASTYINPTDRRWIRCCREHHYVCGTILIVLCTLYSIVVIVLCTYLLNLKAKWIW